jgi:hypothetical protein
MIMSGQKVMAPRIWRALQAHANRRPAAPPAPRMAALGLGERSSALWLCLAHIHALLHTVTVAAG